MANPYGRKGKKGSIIDFVLLMLFLIYLLINFIAYIFEKYPFVPLVIFVIIPGTLLFIYLLIKLILFFKDKIINQNPIDIHLADVQIMDSYYNLPNILQKSIIHFTNNKTNENKSLLFENLNELEFILVKKRSTLAPILINKNKQQFCILIYGSAIKKYTSKKYIFERCTLTEIKPLIIEKNIGFYFCINDLCFYFSKDDLCNYNF